MEPLSIHVTIRKYVLRNKIRGIIPDVADVVQSPLLDLPEGPEPVLVRWISGKKENLVAFITKEEILPDNSMAYPFLGVESDSVQIDAHGVALVNSSPKLEYSYLRGDRFWVMTDHTLTFGTETKEIPAVNLRTREWGKVPMRDVVWYPSHKSHDQTLYTFGGACKELSHGRGQLARLRIGISQTAQRTIAAILNEDNVHPLFRAEQEQYFQQLLEQANARPTQSESSQPQLSNPRHHSRKNEAAEGSQATSSRGSKAKRSIRQPKSTGPPVEVRRQKAREYLSDLRNALKKQEIHMSQTRSIREVGAAGGSSTPRILRPRDVELPVSLRINIKEAELIEILTEVQVTREKAFEAREAGETPVDDQYSIIGGGKGFARSDPMQYVEALKYERLLVLDMDLEKIRPYLERSNETIERAKKAKIIWARPFREKAETCADGIVHCQFSNFFPNLYGKPQKHYHPDPSKCSREHRDHCVSRHPWPGPSGGCLLKSSIARFANHECCVWQQADFDAVDATDIRIELPPGVGPLAKVELFRKAGMPLTDRSSLLLLPEKETGETLTKEELEHESGKIKDEIMERNPELYMKKLEINDDHENSVQSRHLKNLAIRTRAREKEPPVSDEAAQAIERPLSKIDEIDAQASTSNIGVTVGSPDPQQLEQATAYESTESDQWMQDALDTTRDIDIESIGSPDQIPSPWGALDDSLTPLDYMEEYFPPTPNEERGTEAVLFASTPALGEHGGHDIQSSARNQQSLQSSSTTDVEMDLGEETPRASPVIGPTAAADLKSPTASETEILTDIDDVSNADEEEDPMDLDTLFGLDSNGYLMRWAME